MRITVIAAVAGSLVASTAANAAEYLTDVDSDVFQTTGTQAEITERGASCIAQNVKPGTTVTQLIISKDAASGVVVANDGIAYSRGLMDANIRTTLTFEAKDGRFRMRHTAIEWFINGWSPIGKWTGSPWHGAEAAIQSVTASVARCVQNPSQSSNW